MGTGSWYSQLVWLERSDYLKGRRMGTQREMEGQKRQQSRITPLPQGRVPAQYQKKELGQRKRERQGKKQAQKCQEGWVPQEKDTPTIQNKQQNKHRWCKFIFHPYLLQSILQTFSSLEIAQIPSILGHSYIAFYPNSTVHSISPGVFLDTRRVGWGLKDNQLNP